MQKITPFLWFNNNAEEAIQFYVSVFKNAQIVSMSPGPDGKIMMGVFEVEGQRFFALNGGPKFTFTEAISFFVNCATQEEVDELWEKLSEGGAKGQCGWIKDKFGLSWQIIPLKLGQLMSDPNPLKAKNVMMAMMQMTKIDIQKLQDAYDSE